MISIVRKHSKKALKLQIIRYFIMAGFIVVLELIDFAILNSVLKIPYQFATVISVGVSIILNWYFSKRVVFRGSSKHTAQREFSLVLVASLIGLGVQLVVTMISVELLHLMPFVGKCLAIIVGFAWNYWVRKKYIFTA